MSAEENPGKSGECIIRGDIEGREPECPYGGGDKCPTCVGLATGDLGAPPSSLNSSASEAHAEAAMKATPWAPERYRCAKGHITEGEFSYSSMDQRTGAVEGATGPICRVCLMAWAGRQFRTRKIAPPKAKKAKQ